MKKLLVVVDYQNDFVDGTLGFNGAEKLEPMIFAAVEKTLSEGGFVLFTRDTHSENYLETREGLFLPLPHCVLGSKGHQLYGRLHSFETEPHRNVAVINKQTFGCADIGMHAEKLCGAPPDKIQLCGLVTDICVVTNAIILHSQLPNAQISVLEKLCASNNKEAEKHSFAVLQNLGITLS